MKRIPLLKPILVILILVISVITQAQTIHFNKLFCHTWNDYHIIDFVISKTEHTYTIGEDYNMPFSLKNGIVCKYDKNYNLVWKKFYGGSDVDVLYDIQDIGKGKLLVSGHTKSHDSDVVNNYPTDLNAWIFIIDTNGNILHQAIYSGGGGGKTGFIKLKQGPNGDIYICGNEYGTTLDFSGNAPFNFHDNAYIACLDSQLHKKWLKFFITSNDGGESSFLDVDFLPNGHLLLLADPNIVGGDFPANSPTPTGGTVLVEMDTLGNVSWQKRYGANDPNYLKGSMTKIYKDVNKWEYFLVGLTESKTGDCWDSFPYLNNIGSGSYFWIMKIDTLGNKLWSHIYGSFSTDGNETITLGTEIFQNNKLTFCCGAKGKDNYALGDSIGIWDTWEFTIDSIGNMSKHWRFGFPGAAWSPSKVSLNPITGQIYYFHYAMKDTQGKYSFYPHLCDTTKMLVTENIGVYEEWPNNITSTEGETMNLNVYPNPATNELIIENLEQGTLIEIFSLNGTRIKSKRSKKQIEKIDVSEIVRGIYILNATNKSKKYSKKISLQ